MERAFSADSRFMASEVELSLIFQELRTQDSLGMFSSDSFAIAALRHCDSSPGHLEKV